MAEVQAEEPRRERRRAGRSTEAREETRKTDYRNLRNPFRPQNIFTDEQVAEFYAGGDGYVLGAIPFDPALLAEELDGGKTVAELTAWSPRAS